jgi:hypothetical protein
MTKKEIDTLLSEVETSANEAANKEKKLISEAWRVKCFKLLLFSLFLVSTFSLLLTPPHPQTVF